MDLSRYLDLFLAESREHLGAAHTLLSELEQRPAQGEPWRAFMRHAHSLKGMAASMQFDSMVALTHAAEVNASHRMHPECVRGVRTFLEEKKTPDWLEE